MTTTIEQQDEQGVTPFQQEVLRKLTDLAEAIEEIGTLQEEHTDLLEDIRNRVIANDPGGGYGLV